MNIYIFSGKVSITFCFDDARTTAQYQKKLKYFSGHTVHWTSHKIKYYVLWKSVGFEFADTVHIVRSAKKVFHFCDVFLKFNKKLVISRSSFVNIKLLPFGSN